MAWTRFRFTKGNRTFIPKERGIYVFTVALDPAPLPDHGYILYMGITGDDSESNLYKRYSQYLGTQKRPRVYNMLERWEGDLFF